MHVCLWLPRSIARGQAATVQDISGPAFQGFSIQAPPGLLRQAALLQELVESSKVTQVSPDYIASLTQTTLKTQTAPPNWVRHPQHAACHNQTGCCTQRTRPVQAH